MVTAANYSGRPSACLAADNSTTTKTAADSTWTTMREAAEGKAINVQQLVVPADTPDKAAPYLAGLAAQHCTLIVTVGQAFAAAIPNLHKADPALRFVAVDSHLSAGQMGLTLLADADLPAPLARQIQGLAEL
ncbi:hypothetical protein [Kitasatospora sp. HPMI-4]|uniref:hypothetical protein n=1 Tax=Kitasatospora sp. HPMI-4 TaxID=3448443 RepID=UPI003F1BD1FF